MPAQTTGGILSNFPRYSKSFVADEGGLLVEEAFCEGVNMYGMTQRLEALLASGKDSALLRCSLGKAYADAGDMQTARSHLQEAVVLDPGYSVAWKLLGKAALEQGDGEAAREAWTRGVACAQAKGDAQVLKELAVFLRRLDKRQG